MKKILYTLIALFISVSIYAQTPQSVSYQAVARDANDSVITNQNVGIQISILQESVNGTAVYTETFSETTNNFGLINLNIGTGIIVTGDFTTIDWAANSYFVKVEMDITGGTAYEEYGTSQLMSVPYALHAKTAESVTNITITGDETAFDGWDKDVSDDFDGDYNNLTNQPTIPANVSDLNNDEDYITTETDPEYALSAASGITTTDITNWNNKLDTELDGDVNNEIQALSISNDTIYLSNGGFVKLPAGFDGDYNSLINAPTNVSSFSNDANYLATETDPEFASSAANSITTTDIINWNNKLDTELDGDVNNEIQTITRTGTTVTLSNGGGSFTDSVNTYTAGTGINITGNVVSAKTYSVGDFAQGGIVFWVDETGQHGLVCTKENQSTGVRWCAGIFTNTMARGDGPYSGEMNTAIIIANQGYGDGSTYAARICNELQITEGGKTYGDWYLPSIEELKLMFQSKEIINTTALANFGSIFTNVAYWSSTENGNSDYAWCLPFYGDIIPLLAYKTSDYLRLRAIRAF